VIISSITPRRVERTSIVLVVQVFRAGIVPNNFPELASVVNTQHIGPFT
jgi:hypothetical protein